MYIALMYWTISVLAVPVLEETPMSIGEKTLKIGWNSGVSGSAKPTYTVIWSSDDTFTRDSLQMLTSSTSLEIQGLTKGTTYSIKVEARIEICLTTSSVRHYTTRCSKYSMLAVACSCIRVFFHFRSRRSISTNSNPRNTHSF